MIYITAQHPKNSNLQTDAPTFSRFLNLGWVAQKKMNGFRMQAHINTDGEMRFYTKQGRIHTRPVHQGIKDSFLLLKPDLGSHAFDCEWVYSLGKVFLFDMLQESGDLLRNRTFQERMQILSNHAAITPHLEILPIITSVEKCMEVMQNTDKIIEGLVFKTYQRKGWADSGIVRCRK